MYVDVPRLIVIFFVIGYFLPLSSFVVGYVVSSIFRFFR